MNEYQESFNNIVIEAELMVEKCNHKLEKDIKIVQELVDKEVPMKPIEDFEEEECYHEGEYERIYFHLCPVCGKFVHQRYHENYCGNCGQKLDWEVEE